MNQMNQTPLIFSPPRSAERVKVLLRISAFPLEAVRLLPGGFENAQEADRKYLLSLHVDRLSVGMLRTTKLPVKGRAYGGWEAGGSGIIGQYLSACVQMEQATGDAELQRRVNYIVAEMARKKPTAMVVCMVSRTIKTTGIRRSNAAKCRK